MKRGLFTLMLILGVASSAWWILREAKPPPVILIILDTLRADHLGVYGYKRDTSPVLDQFASEHMVFHNAVSGAPWTPPSVATMLTGHYATSHTMMPPGERELAKARATRLPEKVETLAEVLQARGYVTGGITPNPWITPQFGFDQGFDHYFTHIRKDAALITREATEMIDLLRDGTEKPFFAMVHYLDPHDPYTPPAPYSEMFTGAPPKDFTYTEQMTKFQNQYDGEIRFMDTKLGELFQWLKDKGIYDESLIIIVGDHGEQFLEHGDHTHGLQLYNEEINVPLLVKTPSNIHTGAIDTVVSLVDIFPTVMKEVGISIDGWMPGLPLTDLKALEARRGVLSEIDRKYHQRSFTGQDGKRVIVGTAVRDAELQGSYLDNTVSCHDSVSDPLGKSQIEDTAWCEELKELLQETMQLAESNKIGVSDQQSVTMDHETLEQLRSLGYIQ